jgi:hypothetical protein
MTDAEHYQQELEHQEMELEEVLEKMKYNHSKFIAIAYMIRDTKQDPDYVKAGVKCLLGALDEYEQLRRMM